MHAFYRIGKHINAFFGYQLYIRFSCYLQGIRCFGHLLHPYMRYSLLNGLPQYLIRILFGRCNKKVFYIAGKISDGRIDIFHLLFPAGLD